MIVSQFVSKLLSLSLIFFQVGLFTVGGGLASLTLMSQNLVPEYIEEDAFYSFVAVSESTPGPIGINMSTYVGYEQMGVIGSLCLTLALVLPSFISILIIARASKKFQNSIAVQRCFYGLRVASVALIGIAIYRVFVSSVLNIGAFKTDGVLTSIVRYKEFLFLLSCLFLSFTILKKMHPVFFIIISALFGIFFL